MEFAVLAIKEELAEVMQPRPQDCIQGRLAEQIRGFPPLKEELTEASASRAHPRAHRGAYNGTVCATDERENRGCVSCSASALPRAHRGTELPEKCRHRTRQQGKPGRVSEEELLEASTAREREEKDEFVQGGAETKKERQGEVYFRRKLVSSFLTEQAGFRFSVLFVFRPAFLLAQFPLTVERFLRSVTQGKQVSKTMRRIKNKEALRKEGLLLSTKEEEGNEEKRKMIA